MLDALRQFEQAAVGFYPPILTGGAAVFVLAGLCVWLAPLWWARAISGMAGACVGAGVAFAVAPDQPVAVGLTALLGAGFGSFFHRGTLILSGAVLTAALVAAVVVVQATALEGAGREPLGGGGPVALDAAQTVAALGQHGGQLVTAGRATWVRLDMGRKALPVAAAVAVLVVGAVRVRWAGAISGAVLGTCLIAVGLAMALLFKGSRPLTAVATAPRMSGAILAGMVAFGTIVGLVLGPPVPKAGGSQEGD